MQPFLTAFNIYCGSTSMLLPKKYGITIKIQSTHIYHIGEKNYELFRESVVFLFVGRHCNKEQDCRHSDVRLCHPSLEF